MAQSNLSFDEAMRLLTHKSSPKRRFGAKRLRALGDPAAGPALLSALQQEVRDSRTWQRSAQAQQGE